MPDDTDGDRLNPEQQQALDDAKLLAGYSSLSYSHLEALGEEAEDLVASGADQATLEETRGGLLKWYHWTFLMLLVVVIIVFGAFALSGGEPLGESQQNPAESETPAATEDPPTSTDSEPAATPAVGSEEPTAPPGPTHFVGTIISDNGWFTIVVAEDGTVSGTLGVLHVLENGTVSQQGSFAGTIDEDNAITCSGSFSGVSTDLDGNEYPHTGTLTLTAVPAPTESDPSAWQVTADGDPGDAVSVPAHAE